MADVADSILDSVKKNLGIPLEDRGFDPDILTNINAVIFTLDQIGVNMIDRTEVTGEDDTYSSFFGDDERLNGMLRSYISHKVRLAFDPPTTSSVLDALKQMITEDEWRLSIYND